jgi:hypothetical protein
VPANTIPPSIAASFISYTPVTCIKAIATGDMRLYKGLMKTLYAVPVSPLTDLPPKSLLFSVPHTTTHNALERKNSETGRLMTMMLVPRLFLITLAVDRLRTLHLKLATKTLARAGPACTPLLRIDARSRWIKRPKAVTTAIKFSCP